jgi:putative transposase
MRKAFQYRIYPTKKQTGILERQLEVCRWLYNNTLAYRKEAWDERQEHVSYFELKRRIPLLKAEHPELKLVYAQCLQNVTERVDLAFKAFYRRVKEGAKEPGYPRFKGYGRYDSFTFTQAPDGCQIKDGRLVLFNVGHVKIVLHRPMRGKVKTCTIRRSSTGKWYATFSCECEPKRLEPTPAKVGIDVGLATFATLSSGEAIENQRFFRKEEKALAKVQRKHAKLAKGTPERRKHRKAVARVHERVKFRRDNFTHQQSRQIVDRYGLICVEDLTVNRMTHNHCLAKSISDAAWSAFFGQLSCKAEEAGRQFVQVNPAYTTQDCSRCHHRQKMPLSERVYQCPCCLLSIDRDLNASRNILRVGLHSLGIQPVEAPA